MDKVTKSNSESCKIYLGDKEIQGIGDFKMPLQSEGTISFSCTYNPPEPTIESLLKGILPLLPQKCDFTLLSGLFRSRIFSGLVEFTGTKDNSVSGNVIGKLQERYEYTMLSKSILLTAWIVIWGLFVYLVAF